MNLLELVKRLLCAHRYARKWDDHAVATDLLDKLGLDPQHVPPHLAPAAPVVTEAEVSAAEEAADAAGKEVLRLREALAAQKGPEAQPQQAEHAGEPVGLSAAAQASAAGDHAQG